MTLSLWGESDATALADYFAMVDLMAEDDLEPIRWVDYQWNLLDSLLAKIED